MKKLASSTISLLLAVMLLAAAVPSVSAAASDSMKLPSLYKIYQNDFLLGCTFESRDLTGDRFDLIKHHFNALTAENAMKPRYMSPSKGSYNYSNVDNMMDTVSSAGLAIHGHTLAWHSQSADWLNKSGSGALTRKEAKANLEAYINSVAGHFAGELISWDVVNEAFLNSVSSVPKDWRDALRKDGFDGSPWYQAYANGAGNGEGGEDYIYDAFVFARLADPDAVLYYNDYNETEAGKRAGIAMMVEDLNKKWETDSRNKEPGRLLIEGLGMQAHYWTDNLNVNDVEATIKRFIETGAEVSISELDIPAGNWVKFKTLTDDEAKKQATLYAKVFQIFKKYSDNIARVTLWSLTDNYSWRSGGSPLLFDSNLDAKPAFYAVADPDGYLAGKYDDPKTRAATLIAANLEQTVEEPAEPEAPAESDTAPNLNTASSYAVESINRAFSLGIIPQALQGKYSESITRAEFCALAAALIETLTTKEITASKTFDDTKDVSVQKIGGLEIIYGTGGNNFSPDELITRADAAVILERVSRKGLGKVLPEGQNVTFTDITLVSYAEKAIRQMRGISPGIMSGKDSSKFDPTGNYTREESIITMLKLWDYYGTP